MATAPCSVAGLQSASASLADSNFDDAHLKAASVAALALTLKAYGGPDYTTPAALKPMVQDFFSVPEIQVQELHATALMQEAIMAGANAANLGKTSAGLALLNSIHSLMTIHEMDGAMALLRCLITNQRGH